MSQGVERFAEVLLALEAELDWRELGRLACHGDGEGFFPPEQVEAIRESGLLVADDVAAALARLPSGVPPLSLYVGAGVAELAPMLCETLVLGREVVLVSLPGPELDLLEGALGAVGARLGVPLPRVAAEPLGELGREPASHAWLVSVLTDPDAFPALHDRLYGRIGELATGRGDPEEELLRARGLIVALLERLAPPAVLSTTDEELPLVLALCAERGLALDVPELARLSGVVGDPVRICTLRSTP